jgi:hypothetical protein
MEAQMNHAEGTTVSVGSWNRKQYLGIEFVIWRRESTWFWFFIDRRGKGGMIGATTDAPRAIREVRSMIEAILTVR